MRTLGTAALAIGVGAGAGTTVGTVAGQVEGGRDARHFSDGRLSQDGLVERRSKAGAMAFAGMAGGALFGTSLLVATLLSHNTRVAAATGITIAAGAGLTARGFAYEGAVDPILRPTLPRYG